MELAENGDLSVTASFIIGPHQEKVQELLKFLRILNMVHRQGPPQRTLSPP